MRTLNKCENKWWVIRVPANPFLLVCRDCLLYQKALTEKDLDAAVIPEPRVVTAFIGFKTFVAGLVSSW